MGYYTDYKLSVDPHLDLEDELKDMTGYDFYLVGNLVLYYELDYAKWYNSDVDMQTLSLRYPAHLFTLGGVGEEDDDLWRIYYKNGVSQEHKAKIVFPEYNPNV